MEKPANILDKTLDKILDKLEALAIAQAETNIHLDNYNSHLEVHIKRTEALERRMDKVELPVKAVTFLAKGSAGLVTVWGALKLLIGA